MPFLGATVVLSRGRDTGDVPENQEFALIWPRADDFDVILRPIAERIFTLDPPVAPPVAGRYRQVAFASDDPAIHGLRRDAIAGIGLWMLLTVPTPGANQIPRLIGSESDWRSSLASALAIPLVVTVQWSLLPDQRKGAKRC